MGTSNQLLKAYRKLSRHGGEFRVQISIYGTSLLLFNKNKRTCNINKNYDLPAKVHQFERLHKIG